MYSYTYDDINEALPDLCSAVLRVGAEVPSRNGRTRELSFVGLTLNNPLNREILLPDRKANLAAQIAETMWVLAGRDDMEFLSHYLPRAVDYSDDGKVWRGAYGPRLRAWNTGDDPIMVGATVDQLAHVVDLLKNDGTTRRAVMSIYNAAIDAAEGKDIPCNDFLMFQSRLGKVDLHVTIRSNDLMWGWSGINAFEWSVLLEVVAGMAGLMVGKLHFSIASLHLYEPHWAKAERLIKGGCVITPTRSPRFAFLGGVEAFDWLVKRWFSIEELIRTGDAHEDAVDQFPEPMMRSWLRVLQWWWTSDDTYLPEGKTGRLRRAAAMAMQPPESNLLAVKGMEGITIRTIDTAAVVSERPTFIDYVTNLHDEKHAAYGDSWCKRGEMLGIMANIARKIDRLGKDGGGDTATDTAVDLFVYLAKYYCWLEGQQGVTTEPANKFMREVEPTREFASRAIPAMEFILAQDFEELEKRVTQHRPDRLTWVRRMAERAYALARTRYESQ